MREDDQERVDIALGVFTEKVLDAYEETEAPSILIVAQLARILAAYTTGMRKDYLSETTRGSESRFS